MLGVAGVWTIRSFVCRIHKRASAHAGSLRLSVFWGGRYEETDLKNANFKRDLSETRVVSSGVCARVPMQPWLVLARGSHVSGLPPCCELAQVHAHTCANPRHPRSLPRRPSSVVVWFALFCGVLARLCCGVRAPVWWGLDVQSLVETKTNETKGSVGKALVEKLFPRSALAGKIQQVLSSKPLPLRLA